MIHKFQNIHGTSYTIPAQLKTFKEDFLKLMHDILEDKKHAFSDVYVRMPVFWLDKFMQVMTEQEMKYKEIEIRHEKVLIKF